MKRRAPVCWAAAEHTPGALHVDAIPGAGRSSPLGEGDEVDHDLSAHDIGSPEIGSGHRVEIALVRLGTDHADLLVAGQ